MRSLLVLLLASAPAAAREYLAVLPFDADASVSASVRDSLAESLRTFAGARLTGFAVLDGQTQIQILSDQGIDAAKACEGSCALDTARKLNAKVFVSGSIRRPGKLYRGFVRCYLAADGSIVGSIEIKGATIDEMLEQVDQKGDKLFGRLVGEAPAPVVQERSATPAAPAAPGRGFLTALAFPKGQVFLDGDAIGETPIRRRAVEPGAHLVVITAPGHQPLTRSVEVAAGAEVTVSETLLQHAGSLEISVAPAAAKVLIDGRASRAGRTDGLAIGQHVVRAEAPQHKAAERSVTVENGAVARVDLALEPMPGRLVISTNVAASCSVDGGGSGQALPDRPAMLEAAAGSRTVRCTRGGYGDFTRTLDVLPGRAAMVEAKLALNAAPPQPVLSSYRPSVSSGSSERFESTSGLAFVRIPAGSYMRGCNDGDPECDSDEKPARSVYVSEHWLGKTEVTVDAFRRCVNAGRCKAQLAGSECSSRPQQAVSCVPHDQAQAFCSWMGGSLPSTDEWEYAAKGGERRVYPWGSDSPTSRLANWNDTKGGPADVGGYAAGASRWGLLDMAGNLWEWTADKFMYGHEMRGGSYAMEKVRFLRTTHRGVSDKGYDKVGFRCKL